MSASPPSWAHVRSSQLLQLSVPPAALLQGFNIDFRRDDNEAKVNHLGIQGQGLDEDTKDNVMNEHKDTMEAAHDIPIHLERDAAAEATTQSETVNKTVCISGLSNL
ncbi:hypothetical protein L210DRAFT_3499206 [Boletus edulis BED1]|uniref:Uncharacterized protein n=1 Tax=Boletus edulis BED1 TaxID=1328754 RepID=A0AAD4C9M7_BOLED|nr:hypothetical protein L210DRAFT_3499206 [Boletus edulis BED1]